MGKKALVLDDDPGIRLLFRHIFLKKSDFSVYDSSTIAEATHLCENNKFDIVFLDHNVPDGVGWEIAGLIRSNPDKYGTPKIVLMSGSVAYAENKNYDFFLKKPFTISDVMKEISATDAQMETS